MLALALLCAAVDVHTLLADVTDLGHCMRGCTTLDKLHWWGKGIGDDGCEYLASQLARNATRVGSTETPLQNLLLGGNNVGDRCMKAIASLAATGKLRSLRALGLSTNAITDDGCVLIASAMERGHLPSLRDLYMSRNVAVSDACAEALGVGITGRSDCSSCIGSAELERLGLNNNSISDLGVTRFLGSITKADAVLGLRELSINDNPDICRDHSKLLGAISKATTSLKVAVDHANTRGGGSSPKAASPLKMTLHSSRCKRQDRRYAFAAESRKSGGLALTVAEPKG